MKGKAARAATHPSVLGLAGSVTNVNSNPKRQPQGAVRGYKDPPP